MRASRKGTNERAERCRVVIDQRRLIAAAIAIALAAGSVTVIRLSGRPSPASAASLCTSPTYTSSNPNATYNTDPGNVENWWVNNDAWSGSHGPQTINVCSNTSWSATSNQPNDGGQVETYPDTEYDVGGRTHQSTTPISGWNSITSTFAESNPSAAAGMPGTTCGRTTGRTRR